MVSLPGHCLTVPMTSTVQCEVFCIMFPVSESLSKNAGGKICFRNEPRSKEILTKGSLCGSETMKGSELFWKGTACRSMFGIYGFL